MLGNANIHAASQTGALDFPHIFETHCVKKQVGFLTTTTMPIKTPTSHRERAPINWASNIDTPNCTVHDLGCFFASRQFTAEKVSTKTFELRSEQRRSQEDLALNVSGEINRDVQEENWLHLNQSHNSSISWLPFCCTPMTMPKFTLWKGLNTDYFHTDMIQSRDTGFLLAPSLN